MIKTYATDLSDEEWACLKNHLPASKLPTKMRAHALLSTSPSCLLARSKWRFRSLLLLYAEPSAWNAILLRCWTFKFPETFRFSTGFISVISPRREVEFRSGRSRLQAG